MAKTTQQHTRRLQTNASQVSGAAHTSFPALLKSADFDAHVFTNAQSDGGDLRFTTDEAGTATIACEIVAWDTANSVGIVWIKIPTLSGVANTDVYVHYGATGLSQPAVDAAGGRNAVWAGQTIALHNQAADGSNSTGLPNLQASLLQTTPAQSGNGIATIASGQLRADSSDAFASGSTYAFSCWFLFDQVIPIGMEPSFVSSWDQPGPSVLLRYEASGNIFQLYEKTLATVTWSYNVSIDTAYHIYLKSTELVAELFINGVSLGVQARGGPTAVEYGNSSAGELHFGRSAHNGSTDRVPGWTDEHRFGGVARSADWIATEYANQKESDTFWTDLGLVQTAPANGHTHYFPLTVGTVPGTHTDFVATITEASFTTARRDDFFANLKSDGSNMRFAADETAAQLYPFELIAFNAAAKTFEAKVKIPSYATGATLVALVGDSSLSLPAASDTIGQQATWADANRFYPLRTAITDSSGNVADQSSLGGTFGASGLIGNGTVDYTLDTPSAQAVGCASVWITPAALGGIQYYVYSPSPNRLQMGTTGTDAARWRKGGASTSNSNTSISNGDLLMLTIDWDASQARYYLNGQLEFTVSSGNNAFGSGPTVLLGDGSSNRANGAMRDYLVWSVGRSSDWIEAEYLSHTTGLLTAGDMVSLSGGGFTADGVAGSIVTQGNSGDLLAGFVGQGAFGGVLFAGNQASLSTGEGIVLAGLAGAVATIGAQGQLITGNSTVLTGGSGAISHQGHPGSLLTGSSVELAGSSGAVQHIGGQGSLSTGLQLDAQSGGVATQGNQGALVTGGGTVLQGQPGSTRYQGSQGSVEAGAELQSQSGDVVFLGHSGELFVGAGVVLSGQAGSIQTTGYSAVVLLGLPVVTPSRRTLVVRPVSRTLTVH